MRPLATGAAAFQNDMAISAFAEYACVCTPLLPRVIIACSATHADFPIDP